MSTRGARQALGGVLAAVLLWPQLAAAQPTASPLDFGDVRVDVTANDIVTITNDGVIRTINSCAIDMGDFAVEVCPTGALAASATAEVDLSFTPLATGAQSATLTITYDVTQTLTVDLDGTGVAPNMVVSVDPVPNDPMDFGTARVGTDSTTVYAITVANNGTDVLNVSLSESGANPANYRYAPSTTAFQVAAGGSYDFDAIFRPNARGTRTATLTITDSDGLSTTAQVSFDMTGEGISPVLSVSPTTLNFADQSVGTQSAPQNITISNDGDDDLLVNDIAIDSADDDEDWIISGFTDPVPLTPGQDLVVQARFAPIATGSQNAVLVISTDSPLNPSTVNVNLNGNGVGASAVVLSDTALTFGNVDLQDLAPVSRTLSVTNSGNIQLQVTSMRLTTLDGADYPGSEYTVDTSAPFNLAAGASTDIEITYTAAVESAGDYAILELETNAPDAPLVQVSLAGRGVDRHIAVSDPGVTFPPTYRNPGQPTIHELIVTNTGALPLSLTAIMIDDDGNGAFTLSGELPDVIEPESEATVRLAFAPPSAGEELTGSLVLVNNDSTSPMLRVDLAGQGILPPISASQDTLAFGSATTGLDVVADTLITLRNDSEEDSFAIRDIQVTDADGNVLDGFRFRGLTGNGTLEPGEEVDVEVVFNPPADGDYSGVLELVVNDDPLGVPVLTVTAEGVQASLRGSGGCAAGGSRDGLASLLLVSLVIMLGRAGRRRAGLVLAMIMLTVPSAAYGQGEPDPQSRNLDLNTFRPAHGINPDMLTVERPQVGSDGSFALSLWLGFARNPLVVEAAGGEMTDRVISARTSAEIAGSYAFADRFEVYGVMPFLQQTGEDPVFSGIEPGSGAALGDVRLGGKAFIASSRPLSLAASAEMTMPTGTDQDFAGGQGPSVAIRMIGDYLSGPLHLAVNAGALMRQQVQLADVEQGHQILYAAGGAYRFSPRTSAIAELFGAVDLTGGTAGGKPLEAALGGRYRFSRQLGMTVGVGRGLLPGVGAPEVRLFAALGFAVGGEELARSEAERLAGLDSDGDGVNNRDDRCPDQREDRDGTADHDGCPDPDNDGDGFVDSVDRCPDRAEDADGFEDSDGCPDLDNDQDGIDDEQDRCAAQAEDVDGFEDGDGCPDPDNDKDGVADELDQCRDEQETINGNNDDDGCPDQGESLVLVTADRIETFEPIDFRGETARLDDKATRVLAQVAATLRARTELNLRIRAHVHSRGDKEVDDLLSVQRADAVRRWLVEYGIASSRLEGVGFGSNEPLVKGRGSKAKRLNDRIELEIVTADGDD